MPNQSRKTSLKSKDYANNIHKRGQVPKSNKKKEEEKSTLGPMIIALLLILVVGSSFVQIFQATKSGPVFG